MTFNRGNTVYAKGEEPQGFYIIVNGCFEIIEKIDIGENDSKRINFY